MNKLIFFIATLLCIFGNSYAYSKSADGLNYVLPNQLKWENRPSVPNTQAAVLYGDPNKDGTLVMRMKIPAGTKIPVHWHPHEENITVISGSLDIVVGEEYDAAKVMHFPAGSFINIPANLHHVALFPEDTILQVNNFGKWQIFFGQPKAEPSSK